VGFASANTYLSLELAETDPSPALAFPSAPDVRFRIKHQVPIFNRPFKQVANDYADLQKELDEAAEISRKRSELIRPKPSAVEEPRVSKWLQVDRCGATSNHVGGRQPRGGADSEAMTTEARREKESGQRRYG
jgi:integrase